MHVRINDNPLVSVKFQKEMNVEFNGWLTVIRGFKGFVGFMQENYEVCDFSSVCFKAEV